MKFYRFYLNNYLFVHHLMSLVIYYVLFLIAGLDLLDRKNFIITLLILPISYCTSVLCLKLSDLPKTIEKEIAALDLKQH